jgi:hypothetical protein
MLAGRIGQHRFNGWLSHRPSDSFCEDKRSGSLPISRERHGGDGEQIDAVAEKGDDPILTRFIGDITRDGTQAVSKKLARAGYDANECCTRAECPKERAIDARAALIGHVGEKIDQPHRQHEGECRSSKTALHWFPFVSTPRTTSS